MFKAQGSDETQRVRNPLCSFSRAIGAQRNMSYGKNINDPKHWRDRAAEMRALADTMKDADTIGIMNRLADDYDKLADRAAQRQAEAKPSQPNPRKA